MFEEFILARVKDMTTIGTPPGPRRLLLSVEERLRLFDEATRRQRRRQAGRKYLKEPPDRGWKREDLYDRARPR
jgi:hypothetical protein